MSSGSKGAPQASAKSAGRTVVTKRNPSKMTAQKVLEDRELRNTRAKANLMLHEQSKAEMDMEQEGFDEPGAAMRLLKGAATEDGAKMRRRRRSMAHGSPAKTPMVWRRRKTLCLLMAMSHMRMQIIQMGMMTKSRWMMRRLQKMQKRSRMRKRPPGTRMNGRTKAPKGSRQAAKASGGPTNRGGRSRAGAAKKAVAVAARDRAKASLTIGEVSIVMEDIEPATVTFSRASDLFQGCG